MATNIRSRQPLPLIKAARLWRDDPDNDRNQRELAESVDALPVEPPERDLDASAILIAFLDTASQLPGYKSLRLFPADYPEGVAEHVLRLWASARQLPLEERTYTFEDGRTMRLVEVKFSAKQQALGHVTLQWPAQPTVTATAIREALHKPHWTDESTTSLDADGRAVVTKAVE